MTRIRPLAIMCISIFTFVITYIPKLYTTYQDYTDVKDLANNGTKARCYKDLKVPQHVAIIMDGNGRWAQRKHVDRTYGHMHADTAVKEAITMCGKLGIKYLSLYAFSTENWKRPQTEVDTIFDIIETWAKDNVDELLHNDIKVICCGDLSRIPQSCHTVLNDIIQKTSKNNKLLVYVYINYGGRWDILQAVNTITQRYNGNKVSYDEFSKQLSTSDAPDPDILIRTGSEYRISNFMLWQMAYTELFFIDKLWPDFNKYDFCKIFLEYQKRNRRFGSTTK